MHPLIGFHHVTAITAQVRSNLQFYTETLGLRLVKRTVNQDDVSAYHLFYADGLASPGSDLTFFDWPTLPRERRGRQSITRTGLRADSVATLEWWAARLDAAGVAVEPLHKRGGRTVLDFEDFEGQRLSLEAEAPVDAAAIHPWERSPVPAEQQIRGLGPVTITVARLAPTARLLTEVLGMQPGASYADPAAPHAVVQVFHMAGAGAAAELHVAERPDLPSAQQGAGGVHHLALRVQTMEAHAAWQEHLVAAGVSTSGIVERFYFRSIYFREPNGVLFELATDGPGFTADEPLATLGESLSLPPFLEPYRVRIEAGLEPLID